MYIFYHYPLCPLSRQIRILLEEKQLEFELVLENYWHKSGPFPEISPAAGVPILSNNVVTISDANAICEYLEENYPNRNLLGADSATRANTRRISHCFNSSFFYLVSKQIIMQRIVNIRGSSPNSGTIRQIREDVRHFLDYIAYLLKYNKYLSGRDLTLADIVVASHLSVLDYFGDVPWDSSPQVKDWYSVVKSRPSFRSILADRLPGFPPAKHYSILDF